MKRIILGVALGLASFISHGAEPDAQCLSKVKVRVAEVIELFGDVKADDINVTLIRTAVASIRPMDEEPAIQGYRVYTKALFKSTKNGPTTFMNESGVIASDNSKEGCQVLYTKPDVAM